MFQTRLLGLYISSPSLGRGVLLRTGRYTIQARSFRRRRPTVSRDVAQASKNSQDDGVMVIQWRSALIVFRPDFYIDKYITKGISKTSRN